MFIKPIIVITALLTGATSAQEERAPIISFQNGEIKATIEFNVPGVAYDKSPVAIDEYYSTGEATFFNAQQVNGNTNNNGILLDFVNGFGDMANVVFSEMYNGNGQKRSMGLPGDIMNYNNDRKLNNRKLQSMEPVEVTDIVCPTTLSYPIPNGGEDKCLNFHVKIDAGTMSMADATTFENLINSAIDDGYLYDFVLAESEDTNISGLGDPGKGFNFENEDVGVPATLPATEEEDEEEVVNDEAIVINVSGSAWDISSYDGTNEPDFYNAQDVMDNTDNNDILIQFIDGIGSVSNDIFGQMFGGKKKKTLNVFGRRLQRFLQSLEPLQVTDIACPETAYTPPPGVTCLNFEVTILPGDMSSEDIVTFEEMMNEVVSSGDLYDTILSEYPDTLITGLGEPGSGYDYKSAALENETSEAPPTTTEAAACDLGTIVDVAVGNGSFNTLVAAVTAADLAGTLSSDGPFTVFAPTDDAFAALPEGTVEGLLEDIPALTSILTYHVVAGKIESTDLVNGPVTTVNGADVEINLDDGVKVNDSTVIIPDVQACNGVIHVIDAVLIPPEKEAPILDVEGEEELGPAIPDVEETTTTIAPGEPNTDEPEEAPPVACTMELFVCPDGSTVGREGPDCEFPECPEVEGEGEEDQEQYPVEEIESDTPPELAVACTLDVKICPDGTTLSREGLDCEFPECPAVTESTTETHTAGKSGKSGSKSMKSEKTKASKSQDVAFSKSAKKQKTGHEMLVADAKAQKMNSEASSKAFKTKTAKKGADMSMPESKKMSSKGKKSSKGLSMPDVPSKKGKSEKMNDGNTSKKVDTKATKKGGDSSSKSGKGEVVKKMVDAKATKQGVSSKSSKTMLFAKSSKGSAKSKKKLGSKMHKQAHSMPTRRLRGQ